MFRSKSRSARAQLAAAVSVAALTAAWASAAAAQDEAATAAPAIAAAALQAAQPAPEDAAQEDVEPTPADEAAEEGAAEEDVEEDVETVVVTARFTSTGAASATKLNARVLDTPFSVAAYTNDFVEAVEASNVAELYRYMTGVQRAGNTGYDITLRGFRTGANDRNALMIDGLPGLAVRFGSPPTVGTETIEVVRGPASLLYGQAQPGGFVNIITKKPSARASREVQLRGNKNIGDPDRGWGSQISLDATGPFDAEDRFSYRLIADTHSNRGFRDFSYDYGWYLAPMLTWRLSPDTSATVQLERRWVKTHYDTFLVAPARDASRIAPIETTYQEPDDYLLEKGTTATLLVAHRFTDSLKFNFNYRYVDHVDFARGFDSVAVRPNLTMVQRRARQQLNVREYSFGDAYLTAEFNTGPVRHRLIGGVNLGREISDLNRIQFFNGPATGPDALDISVLDPIHGRVRPLETYPLVNPNTPQNLNRRYSVSDASGVYFSDLITLTEQWKVMLGLRYAREEFSIEELKLPGVPDQAAENSDWLPVAGLMFQPSRNLTFYASYSTSFVPVPPSTQDISGLYSFQPTTANSIEGGVKAELFDDRVTLSAAVFDINKENVINSFACPLGTCSEQVGAEQAQGLEVEVNASILPNWQVIAGYSYTDATVTESLIAAQVGAQLTNSPKHSAHLWTRYDIETGPLTGLGFGLGLAYTDERTGLIPTATSPDLLLLPSYTVVDFGVYYAVNENVDLTFKISNLLNEEYYESAGFVADIQIVPGAPRWATVALRARF